MALLRNPQADGFLRRLPGAVRHRYRTWRRRDRRHHRRQRRGQIHLSQIDCRIDRRRAGERDARRAAHRAIFPPPTSCKHGISLVPEGRRLFPSLTVEENLLIGSDSRGATRGHWTLETVYDLFPMLRERAAPAGPDTLRRPAADGRDRPRPDVEPAHSSVRRNQSRPRTYRHPRHLSDHPARQGQRHQPHSRRTGRCAGDGGRRPRLLLSGGPALARGPLVRTDARRKFMPPISEAERC